jgi:aspartate carbamoyltransferase
MRFHEEIKDRHCHLRNLVSVDGLNRAILKCIFERADRIRNNKDKYNNLLEGRLIGSIFCEPSTRTRCSFSAAIQRLGGKVIEISGEDSSTKKGESFSDFVKTIECYTDAIIIRNSTAGSLKELKGINVPIINAGDGVGEHPTQALLDIYTIRRERGTVNGLTICLVGDLKHGRTVHSLAKLLALYNVRLRYVSPKNLRIPQEIWKYVEQLGVEQTEHTDLDEVLDKVDIIYMTRMQRERFNTAVEYEGVKGSYVIEPKMLNKAKENVVIMHPLPRLDEISPELDNDPRAAYFRQMKNGMYVRMALLDLIFNQ